MLIRLEMRRVCGQCLTSRHTNPLSPWAEMATGEGKTLVAVLPIYLHALTGQVKPYAMS